MLSHVVPGSGQGLQVDKVTSVPFMKYPGLHWHSPQLAEFCGATELSGHMAHAPWLSCPVLSLYVPSGQAISLPAEHQDPTGQGWH